MRFLVRVNTNYVSPAQMDLINLSLRIGIIKYGDSADEVCRRVGYEYGLPFYWIEATEEPGQ